jgi:mono/diheme cytochrome c family protein
VIGIALLFAFAAQTARADDPPGAKFYATYCAACHGASGKGGFAPAIGSEKYLSAKNDAAITQATRDGVTAKGMPAWSKSKGGALTDDQIADIVTYLRSLAPAASAPAQNATAEPATNSVLAQTKLTVAQSTNAEGDTILGATLKDNDGTPVSGAVIAFSRAATFGTVDLGTAKTDANGIAALVLHEVPDSAREVMAAFKGDKNLGASAIKIVLEPPTVATSGGNFKVSGTRLSVDEPLLPPEGNLITPNPPLVPTVILALVVGCVWTTYGYVMYQVYRIWRRRRGETRENILRSGGR